MVKRPVVRAGTAALGASLLLAAAGCGSAGSGVQAPTIRAARTFGLAGFTPSNPVRPHTPTTVSFTIRQPSGKPLTQAEYKTGAGPHTGVHLIIVRDDLSTIIHRHPPIQPDGRISQRVTFPAPGRYRVLVDAYPNLPNTLPNFQLFQSVDVSGAYHAQPLPPFSPVVHADGDTFVLHGHPHIKALQPSFLTLTVTDAHGRRATFSPWYGALAHAIFFRVGSLDYFHTHVCGINAPNCTSTLGGAKITGHSTTPGKLTVGVLLPVPGTWRLFVQCRVNGRIVTAPYTLKVA